MLRTAGTAVKRLMYSSYTGPQVCAVFQFCPVSDLAHSDGVSG